MEQVLDSTYFDKSTIMKWGSATRPGNLGKSDFILRKMDQTRGEV